MHTYILKLMFLNIFLLKNIYIKNIYIYMYIYCTYMYTKIKKFGVSKVYIFLKKFIILFSKEY